ncbi:MAG: ATP phosphoribosyltransferase regulatory subunit [Clostridia bacterium]|nr:ATP phosphoribosyltransferase regulatory subunit [Clostridia bacterium]
MTQLKLFLEHMRKENKERNRIVGILEKRNYLLFEPSYFEDYDTYLKCQGRTEKNSTIKVFKKNGEVALLRPDITMNIMDTFSEMIKSDPVRLCYDAMVFDYNHFHQERRQIGAELLNHSSFEADLEILTMARSIVDHEETIFVIGHTGYMEFLMKTLNLNPQEREELYQLVYHKQKTMVLTLLRTKDVDDVIYSKFQMILSPKAYPIADYFKDLEDASLNLIASQLNQIKEIFKDQIVVDLSLISEFEYYEGIIYTAYKKGVNEPVLKGGRYDRLSTIYGKSFPAVGFSLEVDRWIGGTLNENSFS